MVIKIIDNSKVKLNNIERDNSLKEHIKNLDASKVSHIKLIRSVKGELILWETHYKTNKKSKKEVSK